MNCLNGCGRMREVIYDVVAIDVCPECIGVWLDGSELADILAAPERTWPPGVVERVLETTGQMGIPRSELVRELACPACESRLEPVNYQGNSGVIINTCPNRHGVWLDHGELAKIQIFMDKWRKTRSDQDPHQKP